MFKLIIIGDTGVGKSCLMKRVMSNEFMSEHKVTIGVEFGSYGIKMDNKVVKMQIWDTAGQESYKSVTRIFYRGAHIVFLTYDMTRAETFNNLKEWHNEITLHASPEVIIYLVGNKADETDLKQVTIEQAIKFAEEKRIKKVFETSAKTGSTVEEVFMLASKDVLLKTLNDLQNEKEERRIGGTTPLHKYNHQQTFDDKGQE